MTRYMRKTIKAMFTLAIAVVSLIVSCISWDVWTGRNGDVWKLRIVSCHNLVEDMSDRFRTDDFWGFFAARAEMLLRRIETATGKKITREPELFGDDHVVSESYDDGPAQWDPELVEDIAS